MALFRVSTAGSTRLAVGPVADGPSSLLDPELTLGALLADPGLWSAALTGPTGPEIDGGEILEPVDAQEIWAAGVTYARSRQARNEESDGHDFYDRVYAAERPELFLKAAPGRVRGPGQPVAIRADSSWDVPEPELAVLCDARGEVVAYGIGNDMSSRSIEGDNPLYLPQAKVYRGSCAIGPCWVPVSEAPDPADMEILLAIERQGHTGFTGTVALSSMHRTIDELVDWLFRAEDHPAGVVLLTGTGIVPDQEFTLRAGDEVVIGITGLGTLRNPVERTGRDRAATPLD